jgi:hypothetical protein
MVDSDNGQYVEFKAYEDLLARYLSLFDTAGSYVDQVARVDMTLDEAKRAILVVRRLEGL